MKAITIYQPWASLIAIGAKKYETRGWATRYRGPITIHAGKKRPPQLWEFGYPASEYFQKALENVDMPLGAVIATAELVNCHIIRDDGAAEENPNISITRYIQRPHYSREYIQGNERQFGDFTPGRYAWEFANVILLPEPIPAQGKQGLWNFEI